MHSATDRLQWAPPHSPGTVRAFGLAVFTHLLLVAALTWGVQWKNDNPQASFDAELWSSIPQEAAPAPVEVPPPPPAAPAPTPEPTPTVHEAEIALAKKKQQQKQQEAHKAQEEERAKRQAEKQALEQEKQERKAKQQEEALREKLRQENLKRILGQAGATGPSTATGTAQRASGPSPDYAGRIRARIKPNIVFTENIAGNPTAVVEVRCASDGTIMSSRLIEPSGNKAWDDAALKGITRTQVLPRDRDGSVPPLMIIEFRPKD